MAQDRRQQQEGVYLDIHESYFRGMTRSANRANMLMDLNSRGGFRNAYYGAYNMIYDENSTLSSETSAPNAFIFESWHVVGGICIGETTYNGKDAGEYVLFLKGMDGAEDIIVKVVERRIDGLVEDVDSIQPITVTNTAPSDPTSYLNSQSNSAFTYELIGRGLCLSFSINHKVRCVYRIFGECDRVVYFTDGINPVRSINIDRAENVYVDSSITDPNDPYYLLIDCDKLSLFSIGIPTVETDVDVVDGGDLTVGVYYYAVRVINEDGSTTNWTPLFGPVHIAKSKTGEPAPTFTSGELGENANKSMIIKIRQIPQNAVGVEVLVGIIDDDTLQINKVYVSPPSSHVGGEATVVATNLTSLWMEGGFDEIYQEKIVIDTAKYITQVDRHLVLGNVGLSNPYDSDLYSNVVENIRCGYVKCMGPDVIIDGPIAPNDNTESRRTQPYGMVMPFYMRGLMHGEAYLFGVVFLYKSGKRSPVYPIMNKRSYYTSIPPAYNRKKDCVLPAFTPPEIGGAGSNTQVKTYCWFPDSGLDFSQDNIYDCIGISDEEHGYFKVPEVRASTGDVISTGGRTFSSSGSSIVVTIIITSIDAGGNVIWQDPSCTCLDASSNTIPVVEDLNIEIEYTDNNGVVKTINDTITSTDADVSCEVLITDTANNYGYVLLTKSYGSVPDGSTINSYQVNSWISNCASNQPTHIDIDVQITSVASTVPGTRTAHVMPVFWNIDEPYLISKGIIGYYFVYEEKNEYNSIIQDQGWMTPLIKIDRNDIGTSTSGACSSPPGGYGLVASDSSPLHVCAGWAGYPKDGNTAQKLCGGIITNFTDPFCAGQIGVGPLDLPSDEGYAKIFSTNVIAGRDIPSFNDIYIGPVLGCTGQVKGKPGGDGTCDLCRIFGTSTFSDDYFRCCACECVGEKVKNTWKWLEHYTYGDMGDIAETGMYYPISAREIIIASSNMVGVGGLLQIKNKVGYYIDGLRDKIPYTGTKDMPQHSGRTIVYGNTISNYLIVTPEDGYNVPVPSVYVHMLLPSEPSFPRLEQKTWALLSNRIFHVGREYVSEQKYDAFWCDPLSPSCQDYIVVSITDMNIGGKMLRFCPGGDTFSLPQLFYARYSFCRDEGGNARCGANCAIMDGLFLPVETKYQPAFRSNGGKLRQPYLWQWLSALSTANGNYDYFRYDVWKGWGTQNTYSKDYVIFDFVDRCNVCSENRYRIMWSSKASASEIYDRYAEIFAENFVDLIDSTSEITGIHEFMNSLIVVTDGKIYMIPPNVQQQVNEAGYVYTGEGEFLSLPPIEIYRKGSHYAEFARVNNMLFILLPQIGEMVFIDSRNRGEAKDVAFPVRDDMVRRFKVSRNEPYEEGVTMGVNTYTGHIYITCTGGMKEEHGLPPEQEVCDTPIHKNGNTTISFNTNLIQWTSFHEQAPNLYVNAPTSMLSCYNVTLGACDGGTQKNTSYVRTHRVINHWLKYGDRYSYAWIEDLYTLYIVNAFRIDDAELIYSAMTTPYFESNMIHPLYAVIYNNTEVSDPLMLVDPLYDTMSYSSLYGSKIITDNRAVEMGLPQTLRIHKVRSHRNRLKLGLNRNILDTIFPKTMSDTDVRRYGLLEQPRDMMGTSKHSVYLYNMNYRDTKKGWDDIDHRFIIVRIYLHTYNVDGSRIPIKWIVEGTRTSDLTYKEVDN